MHRWSRLSRFIFLGEGQFSCNRRIRTIASWSIAPSKLYHRGICPSITGTVFPQWVRVRDGIMVRSGRRIFFSQTAQRILNNTSHPGDHPAHPQIIHRILQTNSCFRDKVRINNDDYDCRQFYRINIQTYYNNTSGNVMADIVLVSSATSL